MTTYSTRSASSPPRSRAARVAALRFRRQRDAPAVPTGGSTAAADRLSNLPSSRPPLQHTGEALEAGGRWDRMRRIRFRLCFYMPPQNGKNQAAFFSFPRIESFPGCALAMLSVQHYFTNNR